MASEKLFHVGVKALITNRRGKILVFDVNTKHLRAEKVAHWDLPGGRIQRGQNAEETLRREVQEEAGITKLNSIDFFSAVVSNIEIPVSKSQKVGLLLLIYKVAIPEESKIILSDEHVDYEWVTPAIAAKRLKYKYSKVFTEALTNL